MTEKKLRKLTRRADLLEQSKELEETRAQLEMAQQSLENRKIQIEQAGSLAEAALQLNGVFEAAQRAEDQYLENIPQREGGCRGPGRIGADRFRLLRNHRDRMCLRFWDIRVC